MNCIQVNYYENTDELYSNFQGEFNGIPGRREYVQGNALNDDRIQHSNRPYLQ